ncbi:MAG TPA: flavodoxin family protein [Planctomycetaceae bacterium]|nr:flavodoxin family protein [Planctomycetaceae bacterium]
MPDKQIAIGIVGSYRRAGVVASAVAEILTEVAEQGVATRTIHLLDKHIEFCTNCRQCMQQPGPSRGKCTLTDDMEDLLAQIEQARYLVIGSPVNFGNVNALTRRFMERCVGLAYWPWGSRAPKMRDPVLSKRAILVSSSAAPFWIGRYCYGAGGALKKLARVLGARVVGLLWIGLVIQQQMNLPDKSRRKAVALARRLVAT